MCNTCNESTVAGQDVSPASHPALFETKTIRNHSPVPRALYGVSSGRSYSLRKNGDRVAVLKADIEKDPLRFEP